VEFKADQSRMSTLVATQSRPYSRTTRYNHLVLTIFTLTQLQVARKTFIDNIEKQVIRRHLINGLENIFSPAVVAGWNEEEIAMAAAEPKATTTKRNDLALRLDRLQKGIEVFKRAERMTE
jgi:hypothetical protein